MGDLDDSQVAIFLGCGGISSLPNEKIADVLWRRRGRPRIACGEILEAAQEKNPDVSLTGLAVHLDWRSDATAATSSAKKARVADTPATQSQVRVRQILVKHKDCKDPVDKVRGGNSVTRPLAQAERILVDALRAIESSPGKSIFTQRCKALSECSTSLKGGEMAGDLGWLLRGHSHPAVEAAAFALPVGHISDIVESDEGLHVLWRIA